MAFTISKRNFLKFATSTLAMGATLPTAAASSIDNSGVIPPKKFRHSKASKKFMQLFNLKHPIVQAPTGGVVTSDLIAAVCDAGCLGGLPLSWASEESAQLNIETIKSKTDKGFFANFVLNYEPVALETTLKAGVAAIQFSWGMPTPEQVKLIKSFKTILGIQVTSSASAQQAIELGADYLVCQGTEAGGHVHASRSLKEALPRVLAVSGKIPVIASGGISTGKHIKEYLALGAAGVVMGTRFVSTIESGAHPEYKEALVNAKKEDTVFTTCMNKGWDNSTQRILRNSTFNQWEKMGCPPVGKRPGEQDLVAGYGKEMNIERYSIDSPGKSIQGNIEALANYAGTGVSEISDIPTVKELIRRIHIEYAG